MKNHKLKTWPGPFQAILDGSKPWEFRKNDRDFETGDCVLLQEYNLDTENYTGREFKGRVGYLREGPSFGIPFGYCVFTLEPRQ